MKDNTKRPNYEQLQVVWESFVYVHVYTYIFNVDIASTSEKFCTCLKLAVKFLVFMYMIARSMVIICATAWGIRGGTENYYMYMIHLYVDFFLFRVCCVCMKCKVCVCVCVCVFVCVCVSGVCSVVCEC